MAKPEAMSKANRDLWVVLNDIIHEDRGKVVSEPETTPLRFECLQDSDLPFHLSRCGSEVRYVGTDERLWPFKEIIRQGGTERTIAHVRPTTIAVYELDLPAPPSTEKFIPS